MASIWGKHALCINSMRQWGVAVNSLGARSQWLNGSPALSRRSCINSGNYVSSVCLSRDNKLYLERLLWKLNESIHLKAQISVKNIGCYHHFRMMVIIHRLSATPSLHRILGATVTHKAACSFSTWYPKGRWGVRDLETLSVDIKKSSAQLNETV